MYCYINLQYALMEGLVERALEKGEFNRRGFNPLPNGFIEAVLTRTEIKCAILKQTT